MRLQILSLCILMCLPGFVSAATLVQQESSFDIDAWRDIKHKETYYGELTGFPHTFQFLVSEPTMFSATLGVRKGQDPVSFILVKEVSRGVEEVVRLSPKQDTTAIYKDTVIGLRFSQYDPVTRELSDGIYRLEVSAPDNLAKYQLTVGTEEKNKGYFETLSDVRVAHSFFGTWLGSIRSPYVYWPVGIMLLGYIIMRYTRRNIWQK